MKEKTNFQNKQLTSRLFYSILFMLPLNLATKQRQMAAHLVGIEFLSAAAVSYQAGVAQVVAHLIGNEEVGSSSLLASSQRFVERLFEA